MAPVDYTVAWLISGPCARAGDWRAFFVPSVSAVLSWQGRDSWSLAPAVRTLTAGGLSAGAAVTKCVTLES